MEGQDYLTQTNSGINPFTKEKGYAETERNCPLSFRSRKELTRYWLLLISLIILSILVIYGLLVYNNPVAIDSPSFVPVVQRRLNAIIAMSISAVCQGLATIAFQTITNNRIITPSLLGFEALYSTILTGTVFFMGLTALINFSGTGAFLIQITLMIGLCLLLYGCFLFGDCSDMQRMLLVGIILGTGLKSLSSFMRRVLDPSAFDVLQARLFGSVNNADPEIFPLAIIIVTAASVLLIAFSNQLNILTLGKDAAVNLGLNHRFSIFYTLILVSILMSVSTALLGPMTFFGFLAATLTYQLVPTYDHRYLFPMVLVISFLILTGAYFLMYHVFNAQGVVTIIIEFFGGITFLLVLLKRGKL